MRTLHYCLLALLLAGCGANPPLPTRVPATEIVAFAFSGRIAVRQGETRHHAQIDWRHETTSDEILLTTPLGQGIAEITRDAAGARLVLADQRHFSAADWSDLSHELFGFRLPLQGSASWLLGQMNDMSATEGWRIRVIERESTALHALPTLIELEHKHDDISVRLKIDAWSELK
jgi:outer membrane lipoprotein LolB